MTAVLIVLVAALAISQVALLFAFRELAGRVRRLRRLVQLDATTKDGRPPEPTVLADAPAPETAAVTTGGRALNTLTAEGEVLLAFVSPGCIGCEQDRPQLVRTIAERAERGTRTVVVVSEEPDRIASFESDYSGADVIADGSDQGPVHDAYGVSAVPAYCLVSAGTVVGAALDLAELPLGQHA